MATVTKVTPEELVYPDGKIEIEGTGFVTTDISSDFFNPNFYDDVPIVTTGTGYTTLYTIPGDPLYGFLELGYSATPDSSATVTLDAKLSRAFDFALNFDYPFVKIPRGTPQMTLLGLKLTESSNRTLSIDYLYDSNNEYTVEITYKKDSDPVQVKSRGVGPLDISSFRIVRADVSLWVYIGYIDTFGTRQWMEAMFVSNFQLGDMQVSFSTSNNTAGSVVAHRILLEEVRYDYIVSVMSDQARILSYSDTFIKAETPFEHNTTSRLLIGFPDSTYVDAGIPIIVTGLSPYTAYTSLFDLRLSVYGIYSRASEYDKGEGFRWENDYFVSREKRNKNLGITSIWDPSSARIELDNWKSGYTEGVDLELDSLKSKITEENEYWYPRIRRGGYYFGKTFHYYHSEDAVVRFLTEDDIGSEGRAYVEMPFLPKPGAPISVTRQKYNQEDGTIIDIFRFDKVPEFTGIIREGKELDAEADPSYINTSELEFKATINANYLVEDWEIPVFGDLLGKGTAPRDADGNIILVNGVIPPYLFSFMPPEKPLTNGYLDFERKDIFEVRKPLGYLYGTRNYGEFYYGQKLDTVGDYGVDPVDGKVTVLLDENYYHLGTMSFAYKYPLVFDFNDQYITSFGYDIEDPKKGDLSSLDFIGRSIAAADEEYNLSFFPVIRDTVRIFVVNVSTGEIDSSWTQIDILNLATATQKVYQVSPGSGKIKFGDDIHGKILPEGWDLFASYKISLRIEYEPINGSDYRLEKRIDLNKNKFSSPYGFLSLLKQDLAPFKITLTSNKTSTSTNSSIRLKAVVTDKFGSVMQGIKVTFNSSDENGSFSDNIVFTDVRGEAVTYFISSSSLEAIGVKSWFYKEGPDSDTPGTPITTDLTDNAGIQDSKLFIPQAIANDPADIFLFEVSDDPKEVFRQFDYEKRQGGLKIVVTQKDTSIVDPCNSNQIKLLSPSSVEKVSDGSYLIFPVPLSQPFDDLRLNYKPDLVGFAIIADKELKFYATGESGRYDLVSNTVSVYFSYTDAQKHTWTLSPVPSPLPSPDPPVCFHSPYGMAIDRATYINPY